MQVNIRIYINNNPPLKRYLKEHSYWYKFLNRDPKYIKLMEEEMKKEYKLTAEDKIKKLGETVNMASNILNVLK